MEECEIECIAFFQSNCRRYGDVYGYNENDGGSGHKGSKLSEITKCKMSKAKKGNVYRKGQKHSEETKRKISEGMKNKHHTEETLNKMRNHIPWNKGKTNIYSEETKRKMGEKNKGNKHRLGKKIN